VKCLSILLAAIGISLALAAPGLADWSLGDPAKFVQMPDPNGWDVDFTYNPIKLGAVRLADDFECVQAGPITGVHLWFSALGDELTDGEGNPISPGEVVEVIHLSIHENLPPDTVVPYSRPGDELWAMDFDTAAIRAWPATGQQGWIWPHPQNPQWEPKGDHTGIWQANVSIDPAVAFQQQGTAAEPVVYWLDATFGAPAKGVAGQFGWKTSLNTWGSDDANAVAWLTGELPEKPPSWWYPLHDPVTGESLNMAFAITPEPSAVAMLAGAGLIGLVACARRRRRP
jgi:hypothetical protein